MDYKIERCTSVLKLLEFLQIVGIIGTYYDKFHTWYFHKVVKPIAANSEERKVFLVTDSHGIHGGLILKDTKEEKKICTVYLDKDASQKGIGYELLVLACKELKTDKPLVTVSEKLYPAYEKLFNRLGFTLTKKDFETYRHTVYIFNGTTS